jgi:urease accessory protein
MPRATSVLAAADRHDRPIIDTVILDYAQRSGQKITVTGVKGRTIEIDLQQPSRLRTDDLLLLDDGGLVEVVAAPEPLIEARAADVAALRDAAVESLLQSLGAKIVVIEAPFEPEGGAYASSHGHGHAHDVHDHAHDHHGHSHGHDHHDH